MEWWKGVLMFSHTYYMTFQSQEKVTEIRIWIKLSWNAESNV